MEKNCGNCKHYRPHYIPWGKGFRKIPHGHCVHPRLKPRSEKQGCAYFCPKKSSTKAHIE